MKRALVHRQRELLATTLITAVLFATAFVSVIGGSPASALPPPTLHETITVACNNTFNGTKFPLQYIVDSTPSANPVAEGAPFTQTFHVTAIAAASFLNGVYAAVGIVALPINPDKVTIAALANATGADVHTQIASTVTIPKPGIVPVTSDVNIDLGTVVGSYTAGTAPGPATFTIKGDAWSPTDTLPPDQTEAGWSGSTITPSGQQTFETTSLAGGALHASVLCMGGNWTATPASPPTPRVITDGHITTASASLTSATAAFSSTDVGASVTGTGLPAFTTILSVTNATTVVLNKNATATNTAASLTIAPSTTYNTPLIPPTGFAAVDISPPATTVTTAPATTTSTAPATTTSTAPATTTTTTGGTTTTTTGGTTTTTAPATTTTTAPATTTTTAPATTTTTAPATTTTTAPATTTSTAPGTTTTTAAVTTTTAGATTTTAGDTTTTAEVTTTTQPQTEVEGTSTYNTDCHNTLLPDADPDHFSLVVTASALSPVQTGDPLIITNQHWTVTVPAVTADLIRSLGVTGALSAQTTVTVDGANVSPGSITSSPITTSIDFSGGMGTDAVGNFDVPDMTFIPTGGTATFTLSATLGLSTDVVLQLDAPTPVTLTCLPTSGGDFLSVQVYGVNLPSTTTSTPGGPTTTAPNVAADQTLPVTGANSRTLWIEILAGLLMIQIGLLCWTVSQRPRFRKSA